METSAGTGELPLGPTAPGGAPDADSSVVKAAEIVLPSGASATFVLADVMHACLMHLEPNQQRYLASRHPGNLHQSRVAIRRLRSAFSLGRQLLGEDLEAQKLKAQLRASALPLGEARDLDVLLASPRLPPDHPARPALERRSAAAHLLAGETLRGATWNALLVEVTDWINSGLADPDHPGSRQPGLPFAVEALDHRLRRIRSVVPRLSHIDEHDRHRVRIETKKLRYGIQFLESLFADSDAPPEIGGAGGTATYLELCDQVQQQLGDLQDVVVANAYIDEALRASGIHHGRRRAHLVATDADLREAVTAVRALAAATPCWPTRLSPPKRRT